MGYLTGEYKIFKYPKTVYDTSSGMSVDDIVDWDRQALDSNTAVITGRTIDGVAPNGLRFRGYIDETGEVTNFYPIFEGR